MKTGPKELTYQPVVLLAELSEANAAQIEKMNLALEEMKTQHDYPQLDICVIGFHNGAEILQNFRPLRDMEPVAWNPDIMDESYRCEKYGFANTWAAMRLAVNRLRRKQHQYLEERKDFHRPQVYMLASQATIDVENPQQILALLADMSGVEIPRFYTFTYEESERGSLIRGIPFWLEWPMTADFAEYEEPDPEEIAWLLEKLDV